jgi:GNAT superfamily N-acetyltransferase
VDFIVQPLTPAHDRVSFDCGGHALNEFLRRYARQNDDRGIGRTFVAVPVGESQVVGFYTLSAGGVEFREIPDHLRRRLPRYPIPVAHLGRLATCLSVRGQGLGEALLIDAIERTCRIADEIGIVAIEVRAKDDRVRTFYEKYGFQSLLDDPLHLYLPLATARRV